MSSSSKANAVLTVTPGFLQPLTPENVALGANGQVTITGYLAEAGGTTGINYALSTRERGRAAGRVRWANQLHAQQLRLYLLHGELHGSGAGCGDGRDLYCGQRGNFDARGPRPKCC